MPCFTKKIPDWVHSFELLRQVQFAKVEAMELRISRAVAALAWLTCVICPVLEMFDRWDHTLQTGQDTEYTLVLIALCLGVAYVFARFAVKFSLRSLWENLTLISGVHNSLLSRGIDCFFVVPIDESPPPLALRI